MGYYAITGIQEGITIPGQVPLRLEIDKWWESEEPVHVHQKSLVILALKRIQERLPTDPDVGKLSWYQIAGIHGKPYTVWDGAQRPVGEDKETGKVGPTFYCRHGSPLFATWHRPYALLLEQVVYEVMRDEIIPNDYNNNEQAEMLAAAQAWRWPFWDWAAKKKDADNEEDYAIPRITRLNEVKVRTKDGVKTVRNPFYAYKIPKGYSFNDKRLGEYAITEEMWGSTKSTSKAAPVYKQNKKDEKKWDVDYNATKWIKGTQNNDTIAYDMQDTKFSDGAINVGLQDAVNRILDIQEFEKFATTKPAPREKVGRRFSVEGLHNTMHHSCAGNDGLTGHMAVHEVAAFDPIFWLLHCNVDRLVAIWQARHPGNMWFKESKDAKEDLTPFRRNKDGEFHTSQTIEDIIKLGYSYPDLVHVKTQVHSEGVFDHNLPVEALDEKLNSKYGSIKRAEVKALRTQTRQQTPEFSINDLTARPWTQAADIQPLIDEVQIAASKLQSSHFESHDYVITASYKRFGLNGEPFIIHFFVGDVLPSYGFTDQASHIGLIYNFVSPLPEADKAGCENCKHQAQDGLELADSLVLTNALTTRWKHRIAHSDVKDYLASMEPKEVARFLKKHLHWRITMRSGEEIDMGYDASGERVDPRIDSIGLKVAVAVGTARHFNDDSKLSEYSDYKIMYDVTEGKISKTGARREDERVFSPENPPLEL